MDVSEFEQTTILVKAAQAGDRGALDRLFARYLPRVSRIVAARFGRSLRDVQAVEEIVQETLLKAFRSLESFTPRSEGTFCNWLARVAEHSVMDAWRRHGAQKRGAGHVKLFSDRSTTGSGSEFAGGDPTPSEVARAGEMDGRLERALGRLQDKHRELVILRTMCGMSFHEICAELGIDSESTARTWYARALAQLREQIDSLPD